MVRQYTGRHKILSRYRPTDDTTRFVHNLSTPLIDQLPDGPVDDLVISSPFFDQSGTALQRVLDKLQPATVTLATQDTDVLDGATVLAAIQRFGAAVTVKRTVANRYYHGKLIEWTRDGDRFGLTGSANMSAPALLRTVADGGNVETGVIASHPATLEPPDAQPADTSLLADRTWISRDTGVRGPSLLSVIIDADDLVVHLGRPLDTAGMLQFYTGTAWEFLASVPSHTADFPLGVVLSPATPVRLIDVAGSASGPVFVTNPAQATRPRRRFTGRTKSTHDDVFRDPHAFELMVKDLLDLKSAMPVREPAAKHRQPAGHPHDSRG